MTSENVKSKKSEESNDAQSRIRIKVKAYDNKVIDQSVKKIVEAASKTGVKVVGPVPLPTAIKKVTVHKSTFVHEDARDQYEKKRKKK